MEESLVPFFSFRYLSRKKERVIPNDILMFDLVSIRSIFFFSDQINLFYPEFMGTKKAQLGTNLAGLKKQVFLILYSKFENASILYRI